MHRTCVYVHISVYACVHIYCISYTYTLLRAYLEARGASEVELVRALVGLRMLVTGYIKLDLLSQLNHPRRAVELEDRTW